MTETGMILITPLPGLTTTKPGSATFPFPGVAADVVDEDGKSVPLGGAGYLVLSRPWPAMLRGIYKDDKRYRETYWSRYPGKYFAGDGARRDLDGYLWLMGRVDDVMKISGHRISTTEVESALVSHPKVAEAAVIGREDPITGQAIFAFVSLRGGNEGSEDLSKELREHVVKAIGSIARPKTIMFTPELRMACRWATPPPSPIPQSSSPSAPHRLPAKTTEARRGGGRVARGSGVARERASGGVAGIG